MRLSFYHLFWFIGDNILLDADGIILKICDFERAEKYHSDEDYKTNCEHDVRGVAIICKNLTELLYPLENTESKMVSL